MIADGKRGSGRSYLIVAVVLAALVIDGLDVQLLSMVGPKVIEEWKLTTAAFSHALASAVVGVAFGAALGGWLGDFFGHRKVLLWGMFACAVVTALTALTSSILAMTIVRFLTGLAIGAVASSSLVYITQTLSDRGRASIGAITSACGPAGGMLGSAIVLMIEPRFGWRACFLAAGTAMVVTWIALAILRSTTGSKAPSEDVARHAETGNSARGTPLFVKDNLRVNSGAPLAFAVATYMGYSFAWTPVILTKAGLPLSEAVIGYLAYNVTALIGPLITGFALSRVGSRRLMIASAVVGIVIAITLAAAILSHQTHPNLPAKIMIYAGIGGMGAVSAVLQASMYGLVACAYDDGCRGRGVGLGMMAGRLGGLAGIIGGGLMLDSSWGASGIFYSIAAGLILLIAASFVIDRHVPSRAELALNMV